jgi:multiple sugar transport system ATP-binding protein
MPCLRVDAELTEALGSDLLVHFHLDAPTVDTGDPDMLDDLDGKPLMVARVDPRSSVRSGDRVELAVDTERLHFFDPATNLAINS